MATCHPMQPHQVHRLCDTRNRREEKKTDNQGKVLSWEEVGQMLDHLSFLYEKLGFLHQRP
jgi:hypothetical protein